MLFYASGTVVSGLLQIRAHKLFIICSGHRDHVDYWYSSFAQPVFITDAARTVASIMILLRTMILFSPLFQSPLHDPSKV